MITTVLFDFDGTLANTNNLIINSFKHIYEKFGKEHDEDYITSTFGEPLLLTLNRDFGMHNIEDVIASYREYQFERFYDEVFLYSNVIETLEYLKNKGIAMGVVTSRLRNSTEEALRNFNIIKYFDVIITADDTKNHKPHKEPLMMALKVLNKNVNETLFVGDSKFDMECAINAKALPVLVGWQSNSIELKEQYNIKHFLNNMWDLTELI
ncbi:MAG: hypothetical protein K0Q97_1349 [Bacillota bacterium]|jgi:pyrophosphatase PpaX|nr:hypothetical protein [Bacillota bacterium]